MGPGAETVGVHARMHKRCSTPCVLIGGYEGMPAQEKFKFGFYVVLLIGVSRPEYQGGPSTCIVRRKFLNYIH